MAASMKVLFIEEPLPNQENGERGTLLVISEKLHVLQPHTSDILSITEILPDYVKSTAISIGWFYSPAFCPLLDYFQFDTIIYDCMDELTLFKGAPAQLIDQEKYLMANADIIFTGGKSLYESKQQHHKNVHCFPSSVDQSHFSKALKNISIPASIGDIPAPIVGYYGVIDERIDLELLEKTVQELPEVSFVMIGPLAKIEESDLPQAANLYYLGMKCYDELPYYLKAFDIAMMPFALNDATKFISPTKTLEYMAAKKPIISTRVIDVVRDYSSCVTIIETADDFTQAVIQLTAEPKIENLEAAYEKILQKTSWDTTAEQMKSIIKFFAK
ncbi:glycosyltransferase family 1 protein [Flavobacterium ginsengiterrae]|uniref:Glycosyltransferase family 1 protein n=2 Tax=Flavobacterium ginsengiterrae TaxID=871695 RepID=A0ABP7G491_9FLAO